MGPGEMKVLAWDSALSSGKNNGLATQRPREAGSGHPAFPSSVLLPLWMDTFLLTTAPRACPDVGPALCYCTFSCSSAQACASLLRGLP